MELKDLKLARWFVNRLTTIMEHNNYNGSFTVEKCNQQGQWTPTDLIIREWLNNGGGSSKGFLGITKAQCRDCFEYIKTNKKIFIDNELINQKGWNNYGFVLWTNYNF